MANCYLCLLGKCVVKIMPWQVIRCINMTLKLFLTIQQIAKV